MIDKRKASECDGKDAMSAGQAQRVVERMNAKGKGVSSYRCSFCGKWHVGRKS